jgi:hypothetical protein
MRWFHDRSTQLARIGTLTRIAQPALSSQTCRRVSWSALKVLLVSAIVIAGTLQDVQPASAELAGNTPIAMPDGFIAIGELVDGDRVSAGSLRDGALSFEPADVVFSAGTGVQGESLMVYLVFGDDRSLVASYNQVFMLADGTLTTGARLVAGHDLMGEDGRPVPIASVHDGRFSGSVHHIVVTNTAFDGSSDGHLLVAEGVVVGDYLMELHPPSADSSIEHVADPGLQLGIGRGL